MTVSLKSSLHGIGLIILLLLVGGASYLSVFTSERVEMLNQKNEELYENINSEIPSEEIEKLVAYKNKIEIFEDKKTSFSMYEVFQFLSRIIPTSSNTNKIEIDGSTMKYKYLSSKIKDHLILLNTLDKLQEEGIIKEYSVDKIEEQVENKTMTYFNTKIELNIGADFYRGVRDKTPILDTGDNQGLLSVQKIREFLLNNGSDRAINNFLLFNK